MTKENRAHGVVLARGLPPDQNLVGSFGTRTSGQGGGVVTLAPSGKLLVPCFFPTWPVVGPSNVFQHCLPGS